MKEIQIIFESHIFQTILGFILFCTAVAIIAYLIFTILYWTAKNIADQDAAEELNRHKQRLESDYQDYKRQLELDLEEYKRNIHVDTTIDIQIEKGVGYTDTSKQSRENRIKRIV